MNKIRRKKITDVIEQMATLVEDLRDLLEEEGEYLKNFPENMQGSEKYEAAADLYDTLDENIGIIEDACQTIVDEVGV